ncbi:MAG TPA: ABC transporter permease [Woeseiaceae bacterium]|nr:ABC transporter permease [Woeseiaceae bacterium]
MKTSPNRAGYLQLAPGLILVLAAMLVPLFLLLVASFWSIQPGGDIDTSFTLANYAKLTERPGYAQIILRSIGIAACVTLVTILLAYPLAYFVAFDVRKHKLILLILITLPFWTSYLLRVFAWKVILGWNGVINSGLTTAGLIEEPLAFLLYNPFSVVVTLSHAWATFAILPIYLSLEKIDRNLISAAADLGDGPVRSFFRVTLPLSMPGVMAAVFIIFIPTVGDYITPALIGGPDGLMVSNLIQAQFGKANNWPFGAAISVVSIVTVSVIALVTVAGLRRFAGSAR